MPHICWHTLAFDLLLYQATTQFVGIRCIYVICCCTGISHLRRLTCIPLQLGECQPFENHAFPLNLVLNVAFDPQRFLISYFLITWDQFTSHWLTLAHISYTPFQNILTIHTMLATLSSAHVFSCMFMSNF